MTQWLNLPIRVQTCCKRLYSCFYVYHIKIGKDWRTERWFLMRLFIVLNPLFLVWSTLHIILIMALENKSPSPKCNTTSILFYFFYVNTFQILSTILPTCSLSIFSWRLRWLNYAMFLCPSLISFPSVYEKVLWWKYPYYFKNLKYLDLNN